MNLIINMDNDDWILSNDDEILANRGIGNLSQYSQLHWKRDQLFCTWY